MANLRAVWPGAGRCRIRCESIPVLPWSTAGGVGDSSPSMPGFDWECCDRLGTQFAGRMYPAEPELMPVGGLVGTSHTETVIEVSVLHSFPYSSLVEGFWWVGRGGIHKAFQRSDLKVTAEVVGVIRRGFLARHHATGPMGPCSGHPGERLPRVRTRARSRAPTHGPSSGLVGGPAGRSGGTRTARLSLSRSRPREGREGCSPGVEPPAMRAGSSPAGQASDDDESNTLDRNERSTMNRSDDKRLNARRALSRMQGIRTMAHSGD